MAHYRTRHALDLIENALKLSPLVGVIGHRQVGKTTLLERIATTYHVLDTQEVRQEAETHPHQFIKKRAGKRVALDECQFVPALFPELKEWVRTHKQPGQFLLSGSVRFSSREAIRESLTGRIVQVELLPLTLSEVLELPLSDEFPRLLDLQRFKPDVFRSNRNAWPKIHTASEKYFEAGGLPGVCFLRDEKQRTLRLEDQLLTILDRDLRMVRKIQLALTDLKNLAAALSQMQGQALDYSQLKAKTGISTPTIKKVIASLEAVFVIRLIPIEGGRASTTTLQFEDVAERNHLAGNIPDRNETFSHLCFHECRSQLQYQIGRSWNVSQYATRGGARIPWVFKSRDMTLGVVPILKPNEIDRMMGSIRSFFSHYGPSKVLVIHPGTEAPRVLTEKLAVVPLAALV